MLRLPELGLPIVARNEAIAALTGAEIEAETADAEAVLAVVAAEGEAAAAPDAEAAVASAAVATAVGVTKQSLAVWRGRPRPPGSAI